MNYFAWIESKIPNMKWYDISLTKLSVFAFTLMLAILIPQLLSLAWYWYLIVGILAAISPMMKIFKKSEEMPVKVEKPIKE